VFGKSRQLAAASIAAGIRLNSGKHGSKALEEGSWVNRIAAALICLTLAASSAGAAARSTTPVFKLSSELLLPGIVPGWDYLSYDPARDYLFVGRRAEGVTVVDTGANRIVTTIANSSGANMALLVPQFDRGFTANEDGSTTVFQLSSLRTLDRIKLGEGLDSAFYEPETKQVAFTLGDTKELVFVDAKTDRIAARVPMPSSELEASAAPGNGTIWVNERDVSKIAEVDARIHRLLGEYDLPGCTMPTGIAVDVADKRLFIGCRGDKPVLAVVDSTSGREVTTLPIGRGNDGVVFDPATHRIFTTNGIDGNIVAIDQLGPDSYKFAAAFTTRPNARTIAYDPQRHRLFTLTAQGMVDPGKKRNFGPGPFYPNVYFDNTLTLLTYDEQ
jgi:DNA-binding beta-propeller fold protein YncE